MDKKVTLFLEALLSVDKNRCDKLLQDFYSTNQSFVIVEEIISAALQKIGDGWEQGTVSLAQVYMSGVICEELFETYVQPDAEPTDGQCRAAMAVLLDHHALGKRIVLTIAKAHGYPVQDFGCGLDVEQLAELCQENNIELLLISTLMLHAALKVNELKAALSKRGLTTKLIVGGAPFRFDPELWQRVAADGFCRNAMEAVEVLKREAETIV
jgi:methanogenic corrinoid protein MtbC1